MYVRVFRAIISLTPEPGALKLCYLKLLIVKSVDMRYTYTRLDDREPNIYSDYWHYKVTISTLCKGIFTGNSGKKLTPKIIIIIAWLEERISSEPCENLLSWWFNFVNGSCQISTLRGRPTFRRDVNSVSCEKKFFAGKPSYLSFSHKLLPNQCKKKLLTLISV